jgi:hypothetical protein
MKHMMRAMRDRLYTPDYPRRRMWELGYVDGFMTHIMTNAHRHDVEYLAGFDVAIMDLSRPLYTKSIDIKNVVLEALRTSDQPLTPERISLPGVSLRKIRSAVFELAMNGSITIDDDWKMTLRREVTVKKEIRCETCGKTNIKYSDPHDAFYCVECCIWVSEKCDDTYCEFCRFRPETPPVENTKA